MMNFKKLKTYLLYLYLITLSCTIVEILVRFRLLSKAQEYSLVNLKLAYTTSYLCICYFSLICHGIICIYVLYAIYKRTYNIESKDVYIIKIFQNIINYLLWKPLERIDDLVSPNIPFSGQLIVAHSNFLIHHPMRARISVILFLYVPRIFMSLLFCIEIVFYNRIYYFITFLPVLLIPVLYHIFFKLSRSFIKNNLPDIEEHVIVTGSKDYIVKGIYTGYHFKLKPESIRLGAKQADLDEFMEMWWILFRLGLTNGTIADQQDKYNLYVSLICSFLYMLTFSYKIWYLLI